MARQPRLQVELIGEEELLRTMNRLTSLMPAKPENLHTIAELWKFSIRARTRAGKDADGKRFKRYSINYGHFRRQQGLKLRPVDLTFSGDMLDSLHHQITKNKVRIFFPDKKESDKASGHQFGVPKRNLPKRPFFAINRQDIKNAISFLERQYEF